jgi:1,4-dihydroxy-6-naphthoate synthase
MSRTGNLTIASTPDSDDAFYYFALETGRVSLLEYRLKFHRAPMNSLNRRALKGHFPITAISSVVYPLLADRYAILSVGTSVGRGYGPVLVSRRWRHVEELRGRRVGVGGIPTTGWFLLCQLCPEAIPVEMPFDHIGEAVAIGALDAGVMIHEELLYYPRLGLHRVADLGAEWCREHDVPLPVGLNVIRRDINEDERELLCALLRRSLLYALEHCEEALAWVRRFGRGAAGQCTKRFVEMFANEDSVRLPADVRQALPLLFAEVAALGLGNGTPPLDFVEGSLSWTKQTVCSH